MTIFIDGPAAGQTLHLRRSPLMLRVVRSPLGKWDALDQMDDVPATSETVFVYRLAELPTRYHLCIRGKGRKDGGFYANAKYALLPEQPGEKILRDNAAWALWCVTNQDRLTPAWARKVAPMPPTPERDFFKEPPISQCRECNRQITFALNIQTGKEGPLDYKSTIYVARRRDCDQYGLKTLTAKQFLETVEHIQLKDGSRVDPAELRFLSTHFESCPAAKRFSGKSRRGAVRL